MDTKNSVLKDNVKIHLYYFMKMLEQDIYYAGEGETTVDLKALLTRYKDEYSVTVKNVVSLIEEEEAKNGR